MTTKPKIKSIRKGFKYISQMFEEEKQDEIQIGFPTDVKHVAHIGWDGPKVDSPSWMKEFSSSPGIQHSAPLGLPTGDPKGEPEIKWVSEDASTKRNKSLDSPGRETADMPKSSRRSHSTDGSVHESTSPKKKDLTSKPRRRNHSKDSSEGGVKSSRNLQETSQPPSDAAAPGIPDPAKKSRRKKSRDLGAGRTGEGSTRSRPKAASCGDAADDPESVIKIPESPLDPTPII